jgi:perosamine synthetase
MTLDSGSLIPVNIPDIRPEDVEFVTKSLREGWISGEGPFVELFEQKMASACGRKYAVAVANGTLAVDLAIESLGLRPGDEVIVPSFTIISCINQILRAGLIPVFVDANKDTWNFDAEQVESKINSKTKAIMVVHIYGLTGDLDRVLELARKNNLLVIEDAAEAQGLAYRGKPCGSFGDVSTFSFYANKNITTGEGGMILTDDVKLVQRLRKLRSLAFEPERRFLNQELGWNARLSSMACALGVSQLTRLDAIVETRRALGRAYQEAFKGLDAVQLPIESNEFVRNGYWVFGMVLRDDRHGDAYDVQSQLNQLGIGTRPFFYPLHRQPVLAQYGLENQGNLPVSDWLASKGFYIPNGLGMTMDQVDRVISSVIKVLE